MAIICIFDNPNGSTELYDRVSANVGDAVPEGAIFHAACARKGGRKGGSSKQSRAVRQPQSQG